MDEVWQVGPGVSTLIFTNKLNKPRIEWVSVYLLYQILLP